MKVELYHTSTELKQLFRKEKDARLPPYSPQLNPIEKLWQYLRQHHWSNRVYEGYDHLRQALNHAWKEVCVKPKKIKAICRAKYIENTFI